MKKKVATPTKGTIVVLEDSETRVVWLRKVLPQYKILAFAEVKEFVAAVSENRANLKLVIFDHDLGQQKPPEGMYMSENDMLMKYDSEGKTGHDAAHEVEPFNVPALIWSHNPSGRRSIALTLARGDKAKWIQEAAFVEHISYTAVLAQVLR